LFVLAFSAQRAADRFDPQSTIQPGKIG